MSKETGGPAFPREDYQTNGCGGQEGMTMRDYFAGKAMHAILSQDDYGVQAHAASSRSATHDTWAAYWAHESYAIADAMLTERLK